jgi:ABC-type lipoprotein export system ATPase subunit
MDSEESDEQSMPNDRSGPPYGANDDMGTNMSGQPYEGADLYEDDDDYLEGDQAAPPAGPQLYPPGQQPYQQPYQQQPYAPGQAPMTGPQPTPRISQPMPQQAPPYGVPGQYATGAPGMSQPGMQAPMPPMPGHPGSQVTIVANGLRKDFVAGDEVVHAVDGVSFSFAKNQFVAITGPSGCGKTTLLYMLGSLEQPTGGSAIIDGVDVATLTPQAADQFRRKSIGMVFQQFYLIPNLSAMENVMLPMEIARVPRKDRRERAEYLLQQVGLDKNRHSHLPSKLSGGQQQRVAIARALANDPSVILADEPTGNLDSNNSKRLVSLLKQLAKQGRTIIMVTHDRGIARLADVRVDLVDGRIVRMLNQGQSAPVANPAMQSMQRRQNPGGSQPGYAPRQ